MDGISGPETFGDASGRHCSAKVEWLASLQMPIFGCKSLDRPAKLADAVFGLLRLAGWKAVVAMPPGDKIAARRPNRMRSAFGHCVAGAAGSSGQAVKARLVEILSVFGLVR